MKVAKLTRCVDPLTAAAARVEMVEATRTLRNPKTNGRGRRDARARYWRALHSVDRLLTITWEDGGELTIIEDLPRLRPWELVCARRVYENRAHRARTLFLTERAWV